MASPARKVVKKKKEERRCDQRLNEQQEDEESEQLVKDSRGHCNLLRPAARSQLCGRLVGVRSTAMAAL